MTPTDTSVPTSSATGLPRGIRLAMAATLGLVAPILTALVALGGIAAVKVSGATLIREADGVSILEWAPPLLVWQWAMAGIIEFTMIAAAATAWWAALAVWRGQFVPEFTALSARRFTMGAGFAMIAATGLALVMHIRNWREWHTLIAQHPEWGEGPQPGQIPVGTGVALVIILVIAALMGLLGRKRRRV